MTRLIVGVLALIGLASLFFGAGAGPVLLAPIFILFKVLFFLGLVGFVTSGITRRGYRTRRAWEPATRWRGQSHTGRGASGPSRPEGGASERERLQEWHDLEHAHREVESWTEGEL